MSWAKLPSEWIRAEDPEREIEETEPSFAAGLMKPGYLLRRLSWREHRATAWAAAFMTMVLAVRLNAENKRRLTQDDPLATTGRVAVTYDDLQDRMGVARQTVCKAISVLKELGAIHVAVHGRTNWYELLGVHEDGKWCQVPVEHLNLGGREFGRLSAMPKNLNGLNALKIYMVLLALRSSKTGTTAIGYQKLQERTGVRREDIPAAIALLTGSELIGISFELDARSDTDTSRRYIARGLPVRGGQ